ncbi:winged helix-turn-helix transcriptional regulator [Nocardia brevicatena]|uniref:winged helix-turn-helix transcriptional regulator n=1 Tax=Nocardia brevicatena TaxID=37327 RepID=UPI0005933C85|nr:helix-turn-helix domain-containing protein [Nocardia brevicatena]
MGAKRFGPYFCGIDAAMDVIGGKWKGLILWELETFGVRRFGELRRGLPGVSEKMLIQQLRELEEDGIITREVYREVPPRVEYRLTDLGRSLNAALEPLGEWGRARIDRIGAARVRPVNTGADA